MRIYCPKCGWRPIRSSRWYCTCLHAWNTFDTHGVCPSCNKQWNDTQCLDCARWSPHDDWYHGDPETSTKEREREREKVSV